MSIKQKVGSQDNYITLDREESYSSHWKELINIAEERATIRVSELSLFDHDVWDFRKEGVPERVNFKAIIGNGSLCVFPFLVLLKLLVYSLIGLYAVQDRSPRTVKNIVESSKQFVQWIAARGYLVSQKKQGYFKLPRDLDFSELSSFYSDISLAKWHPNTKWDKVRLLSEWWKISNIEGVLPSFLKLDSDPLNGNKVSDLLGSPEAEAADSEESGWLPIPLEHAFPLADAAAGYVEQFNESLAIYYNIVHETILKKNSGSGISRGAFEKECALRGVTIEELEKGLPFKLEFLKYASPSYPKNFSYRLDRKKIEDYISNIKLAAIIIILFTTGLRSQELRGLLVGCCVNDYSIGVDEFYRMTLTIKKTSKEYIEGQIITIPVPKITFDAVRILERLGSVNRRGNILVAPLMANEKQDHVVDAVSTETINNYVKGFAKVAGVAYEPHPHQFRKTIAGWFVLNSPVLGPLLVMRLFSHRSIAMTEMYLRNNPMIQSARQEMLIEQTLKLVDGISRSAQQGKLAGNAGKKIEAAIVQNPLFQGLTGDDLGASMSEYLRERARFGSMHFLLTPLAICAFDPEDENVKPCAHVAGIGKEGHDKTEIDMFLKSLPIVSQCVGVKCDKCIVTDCKLNDLEQSLDFYSDVLRGAIEEDYAQSLHLISDAREFVKLYAPVIEKIR